MPHARDLSERPLAPEALQVLAVSVGNTRTQYALFEDEEPLERGARKNESPAAVVEAIAEVFRRAAPDRRTLIVVATVNPAVSDRLANDLERTLGVEALRIGREIPIAIERSIAADSGTGEDRLLAAAAAFNRLKQAVIVVDAGTAVTIDFVDGAGVFQGGAIAPGAGMMLRALARETAQLEEIELTQPDSAEPFGKNTAEAMLNGVYYGVRGMVRLLAERYAERYGAYPQIIATGGDARLLFEDDDFIEQIADDLVLRGIAISCRRALLGDESEGDAPAVEAIRRRLTAEPEG